MGFIGIYRKYRTHTKQSPLLVRLPAPRLSVKYHREVGDTKSVNTNYVVPDVGVHFFL